MLTEKDLDLLMQQIQSGEETYLYYVAHMIEPREGLMDEHFFKSSSKFKVIKIRITDIQNAYFEYLNYVKNPSNYHVETEESYYDYKSKYIHYYTVPNAILDPADLPIIIPYMPINLNNDNGLELIINDSDLEVINIDGNRFDNIEEDELINININNTPNQLEVLNMDGAYNIDQSLRVKEFNPRMPSIIYGYRRKFRDLVKHEDKEMSDVSPVKVKYTNALYYEGKNSNEVRDAFADGKLDWKYKKLNNPELVDGIEFNYITSNWYILDIENFPTVEKPLINTQQYCSYFRNLVDAFNFLEQLKA